MLQLFNRMLKCCFALNDLKTTNLHLTVYQHGAEKITTEFSFLGEEKVAVLHCENTSPQVKVNVFPFKTGRSLMKCLCGLVCISLRSVTCENPRDGGP